MPHAVRLPDVTQDRKAATFVIDGADQQLLARYSAAEETWNTLTHGIGLYLSLGGFFLLIAKASQTGSALHISTCAIYGASLVALYAASTLYHGVRDPRLKETLRVVDHCAIYLLIAGTYTPFTLVVIRGGWGWTLFGLVWGIAALGLLSKILLANRFRGASVAMYLVMGWLVIIAVEPLLTSIPPGGLIWLLLGGLAYTGGTVFYASKKVPYNHAVWHVFVLAGSICHYLAVVIYVLPAA